MKNSETGAITTTRGSIPGSGQSVARRMEQVVGLEIRRVLLQKLVEIEADVIGRTHICNRCGEIFISRRRGLDIRWCDDCRK